MSNDDEKLERLKNLISIAESYILEKSNKINRMISFVRKRKDEYQNAFDLINDNYKPKYKTSNKIDENILLERFCIELQNYQAMPRAIDYSAYQRDDKNNDLFEYVQKKYQEFNKISDEYKLSLYESFIAEFNISEEKNIIDANSEQKKILSSKQDKSKFNVAWLRYSIGIAYVFDYIKNKDGLNKIKSLIDETKKEDFYDNIVDFNDKLKDNLVDYIYYLGKALSYDLLKELCCDKLIKDDTHIIKLYQEFIDEKCTDGKVVKQFFNLYKRLIEDKKYNNYTLYYIDKLLWLCCTGEFYNDGFTINNFTRKKFIRYANKNGLSSLKSK